EQVSCRKVLTCYDVCVLVWVYRYKFLLNRHFIFTYLIALKNVFLRFSQQFVPNPQHNPISFFNQKEYFIKFSTCVVFIVIIIKYIHGIILDNREIQSSFMP